MVCMNQPVLTECATPTELCTRCKSTRICVRRLLPIKRWDRWHLNKSSESGMFIGSSFHWRVTRPECSLPEWNSYSTGVLYISVSICSSRSDCFPPFPCRLFELLLSETVLLDRLSALGIEATSHSALLSLPVHGPESSQVVLDVRSKAVVVGV